MESAKAMGKRVVVIEEKVVKAEKEPCEALARISEAEQEFRD